LKGRPTGSWRDYNFDFDFRTRTGDAAFSAFLQGGVWKWVRPQPLIDTNWADRDRDGRDDFPESMLDFVFVANGARKWQADVRAVVRDGDLIGLKRVRPRFLPPWLGMSSENAAHRAAVQWDDKGEVREAVYVRRRDTSSRLNSQREVGSSQAFTTTPGSPSRKRRGAIAWRCTATTA
jgi:hypothetical protein